MKTYYFSHIYEGERIMSECCATTYGQASERMQRVLKGSPMRYWGFTPDVAPKIHLADIAPMSKDPVCKDYPYETIEERREAA